MKTKNRVYVCMMAVLSLLAAAGVFASEVSAPPAFDTIASALGIPGAVGEREVSFNNVPGARSKEIVIHWAAQYRFQTPAVFSVNLICTPADQIEFQPKMLAMDAKIGGTDYSIETTKDGDELYNEFNEKMGEILTVLSSEQRNRCIVAQLWHEPDVDISNLPFRLTEAGSTLVQVVDQNRRTEMDKSAPVRPVSTAQTSDALLIGISIVTVLLLISPAIWIAKTASTGLFLGRVGRGAYTAGMIILFAAQMGFIFLSGEVVSRVVSSGTTDLVGFILLMAPLFWAIRLNILRFHDIGRSGWYVFALLVPGWNIVLAIQLFAKKGDQVRD